MWPISFPDAIVGESLAPVRGLERLAERAVLTHPRFLREEEVGARRKAGNAVWPLTGIRRGRVGASPQHSGHVVETQINRRH